MPTPPAQKKPQATEKKQRRQSIRPVWIIIGTFGVLGVIILVGTLYLFGSYAYTLVRERPAPCEQLKSESETQAILGRHRDLLGKLGQAGAQDIYAGTREDCPGKVEILITHGTESEARAIRKMLGASILGLPYRLVNM